MKELLKNGYPLDIFSIINRIKTLSKRIDLYNNDHSIDDNIKKFFPIPYVKKISEKFKMITEKKTILI